MQPDIKKHIENILFKQKDNFELNWKYDLKNLDSVFKNRIISEIEGLGPLDNLILNSEITEILANSFNEIFYEISGELISCTDHFYSQQTYLAALDRLAQKCGTYLNREKPFVEAQTDLLRVSIIDGEISRGSPLLSIRKQPDIKWNLAALFKTEFINTKQLQITKEILTSKNNFLVVGETSSGKTSFLQSLIETFNNNERLIIIEDTQELKLPNNTSISLLTRTDPSGSVADVDMCALLKRALRLRPDRIIVGEVRGAEAMSLLMALATGHRGSFSSLHAASPKDAMLRLEMLIQMGAPSWNLNSVRKLLASTLKYIFVLKKDESHRQLAGIYEISSLEENGFTFFRLDE